MVLFRYLDGFWDQGTLPYPMALSAFSNLFVLTYFVSFIWMFGIIGGIVIALLCLFQVMHSACLWIFLLPNLVETLKNLDKFTIPKVNYLAYGGFSYIVVLVIILTGINFFVSSYKSMWTLMGGNPWKPIIIFLCILIVGNIGRLAVMSKYIKE